MTISDEQVRALAARLIAAHDGVHMLPPLTRDVPDLAVADAYRVLGAVDAERMRQGWVPVGRKIGFTNTTIWERYGVFQPMWARIWSNTVHAAPNGSATLSLAPFVQPRLEPEVAFGIGTPPQRDDDVGALVEAIAWIAPSFEIVQSHFPDWKFRAADCTAASGLHGALVIGPRTPLDADARARLYELLPEFELTLRRGSTVIDRGIGANVLGGPLHAMRHLVRVLAAQPEAPPLAPGEIVTTGTVTDAWPVTPGESWSSDYGALGLPGLHLTFT